MWWMWWTWLPGRGLGYMLVAGLELRRGWGGAGDCGDGLSCGSVPWLSWVGLGWLGCSLGSWLVWLVWSAAGRAKRGLCVVTTLTVQDKHYGFDTFAESGCCFSSWTVYLDMTQPQRYRTRYYQVTQRRQDVFLTFSNLFHLFLFFISIFFYFSSFSQHSTNRHLINSYPTTHKSQSTT